MPTPWQSISDDDLLNYNEANTGQMARYDRIMSHKTQKAAIDLKETVSGLGSRISLAGDGVVDTLSKTNRFIHNEAEKIIESNSKIAAAQSKLQWVSVGLSVVIALSTAAYVYITLLSIKAMNEANSIQREILSATRRS